MNSFKELKQAIKDIKTLVWNDPDPIKGNDYIITYIEPGWLFEQILKFLNSN